MKIIIRKNTETSSKCSTAQNLVRNEYSFAKWKLILICTPQNGTLVAGTTVLVIGA